MCQHYKRCGGCQIRHIKYDAQLDIKRDIVENAMQRIGKFENFKVDGIVGMDVPERYRNKMVFPVGNVYGKNVCGFYAMRSHDIIPLDDCSLGDEINKEINDAVMKGRIKALSDECLLVNRFLQMRLWLSFPLMQKVCRNVKN